MSLPKPYGTHMVLKVSHIDSWQFSINWGSQLHLFSSFLSNWLGFVDFKLFWNTHELTFTSHWSKPRFVLCVLLFWHFMLHDSRLLKLRMIIGTVKTKRMRREYKSQPFANTWRRHFISLALLQTFICQWQCKKREWELKREREKEKEMFLNHFNLGFGQQYEQTSFNNYSKSVVYPV